MHERAREQHEQPVLQVRQHRVLQLQALLGTGYVDEARSWREWLLRAVAGDPADLQIMYTVDGGRQLPEREVPHLAGDDLVCALRSACVGWRALERAMAFTVPRPSIWILSDTVPSMRTWRSREIRAAPRMTG